MRLIDLIDSIIIVCGAIIGISISVLIIDIIFNICLGNI